ncbi:MAG: TldD/PmbA family protein [Candidatus Anstonellales archaeon]
MYTEIRREYLEELFLTMINGELKIGSGLSKGVSARALKNGWGFASGANEAEVVEKAEKIASARGEKIKIVPSRAKYRKKISDVVPDSEYAAKFIKEVYDSIDTYKKQVSLKIWKVRKEFENSEAAGIEEESFYVYGVVSAFAKKGNRIEKYSSRIGERRFDEKTKQKFFSAGEEAKRYAKMLLKAKRATPCKCSIVLDSEITGLLSHEAVGHASEADSVLEGQSLFKGKIGKRIASKNLTIVDNPFLGFGSYFYDDEGHEGREVKIIENGVLKEYLNDEHAAKIFGKPNGHARAQSFAYQPIVRMSNTYILPGDAGDEEMFEGSGVFLKGMSGGSVDPFTGGFMFKASIGWKFRNGKFLETLKDVVVSGNFLETIKNVELIGKEVRLDPGFCGKGGQSVPVSDGGPKIRVKAFLG